MRPADAPRRERGFVLIAVLVVLLALLVLTAPFLATARNASSAGAQAADRAEARLGLSSAARHARAHLSGSHPAFDETPWSDGPDELLVPRSLPKEFLDPHDPNGAMWDLDVWDESGRIDLDSASPFVLGNLTGLRGRLSRPVEPADRDVIPVNNLAAFPDSGVLILRGEWIQWSGKSGGPDGGLTGLTRGLGAVEDDDGKWSTDGPLPPVQHGVGDHAIDQRAYALPLWRIATASTGLRGLDAFEQLAELDAYSVAGSIDPALRARMRELGTVHGDIAAGRTWQRPTRLLSGVTPFETYTIRVEEDRWFAEGTTVWISDGQVDEYRIVMRRARGGTLVLDQALEHGFDPWRSTVRPLARRPVNLNTAPAAVLEVLFEGLQVAGRNERITASEARDLATVVQQSRPIDGWQDFLERIVLPAAGLDTLPEDAPSRPELLDGDAGFLDPLDATALYLNGLNANDSRLAFSTMPFAFTSREVYGMHLRSAVAGRSGVERARADRDRWELISPPGPLFELLSRQVDLEEAVRLDRESAWWATGPQPVVRFDGVVVPPSRFAAHMGTVGGSAFVPGLSEPVFDRAGEEVQPQRVFASREEDGFAQLWPARVPDAPLWNGHALHFDQETSSLEGRWVAETGSIVRDPASQLVGWTTEAELNLLRALSFQAWFQLRQVGDSTLLDVAGTSVESDRVQVLLEGPDLVVRVLDGFGDHPDTPEREAAELRYAIAAGEGPGLPAGVWHHLALDVSGTRPDQLGLLVNGLAVGVRRQGQSITTGPISDADGFIPLERTEGFPAQGVARIGTELVEYVLTSGGLDCTFNETGPLAGFGGRFAREMHDREATDPADVTIPAALARGVLTTSYPSGTTVQAYGYSIPASSNIPAGGAVLPSELGAWRVARVVAPTSEADMDPIFAGPFMTDWGKGIEADRPNPQLRLRSADDPNAPVGGDVMRAFSPTGGYAALLQLRWNAGNGSGQGDAVPPGSSSTTYKPLGGVELVRYSGWSGDTLSIAARGDQVLSELQVPGEASDLIGGTRVFVLDWRDFIVDEQLELPVDEVPSYGVFVIPISVPAPGASDISFLPPEPAGGQQGAGQSGSAGQGAAAGQGVVSEYAQLTRVDQAEFTEWIRYDEIQVGFGQLVRCDPGALNVLYTACVRPDFTSAPVRPDVPGGGGGGGGGGAGGLPPTSGSPPPGAGSAPLAASAAGPGGADTVPPAPAGSSSAPALPNPAPGGRAGVIWEPRLGAAEDGDLPLTRSVGSWFRFRGVLGTSSHDHPNGTQVLPVWHLTPGDPNRGRPGAQDRVFVSAADPTHPGWPMTVHRAHRAAAERPLYGWEVDPAGGGGVVAAAEAQFVPTEPSERFQTLVAFNAPLVEPIAAANPGQQGPLPADTRLRARIAKHPSGERPRTVAGVVVGGEFQNRGSTVDAVVDEVLFPERPFGIGFGGSQPAYAAQGGSLILAGDVAADGAIFPVLQRQLRLPQGNLGEPADVLNRLPQDAGLLRVGEEIVCYEALDPGQGLITVGPLGRGLLGTDVQPHGLTEPIQLMDWMPVTTLAGGISAGDAELPLADADGFPQSGTVLIEGELIHYTRLNGGTLSMPRTSTEPGQQDANGNGLFRGRFGTAPASHAAGAPVILFPFRYWDRWTPRADAPELAYLGLERTRPGGFWGSFAFESEPPPAGGARIGVLVRSDASTPWDADPREATGLWEWFDDDGGRELPLEVVSDRLEWRFFVEYPAGSFDPILGTAHGWRATPRFNWLGVSYEAPSRVLGSVDR